MFLLEFRILTGFHIFDLKICKVVLVGSCWWLGQPSMGFVVMVVSMFNAKRMNNVLYKHSADDALDGMHKIHRLDNENMHK